MIHKLQDQIAELLRAGLVDSVPDPASSHIVPGPPTDNPRPLIAVYGGDLRMGAKAADFSSSNPRPTELKEEFPVQAETPEGPYALAKTPLAGSALCKLVFDKGGMNERRRLLVENKDFSIDYTNARLSLQADTEEVSHVLISYSFAGIFFVQEFHQEFFIEILGPDSAALERLASLTASIIFTHHYELIDGYNRSDRTIYLATRYLSEHWIGRLAWEGSLAAFAGNNTSLKMKFSVNGQIKHVREDVSGFGIIEKIHSPGETATGGVNISPELG